MEVPIDRSSSQTRPADTIEQKGVSQVKLNGVIVPISFLVLHMAHRGPFLGRAQNSTIKVRRKATPVITRVRCRSFTFLRVHGRVVRIIFARTA